MRLKVTNRRLSVRALIRQARASGSVPATATLAPATVYRLLRHEGLMRPSEDSAGGQYRHRFSYLEAGALWMKPERSGIIPYGNSRNMGTRHPQPAVYQTVGNLTGYRVRFHSPCHPLR